MRGLKLGVVLAALAALIVTSIAVADETQPMKFTSVTAHFAATGKLASMSCAAATSGSKDQEGSKDQSGSKMPARPSRAARVKVKRATFSGTATSSFSGLNGTLQVKLRAVVGDNGLGFATGSFTIGKLEGNIIAVVSEKSRLDGVVRAGRQLIANFSGTLTGSTLTLDIGSGSSQNTAVAGVGVGTCGS